MDAPASDTSQDSSDSSSADSTSANSPAQTLATMRADKGPAETMSTMSTALDDDDSDSDVSMSTDTDEEEEEDDPPKSSIPVNSVPRVIADQFILENKDTPKKRKFSGPWDTTDVPNGQTRNGLSNEDRKRVKPDALQTTTSTERYSAKDRSLLPAELWHHIFSFCLPRDLGHLLRVNKLFRTYIDVSSTGFPVVPLAASAVVLKTPDNIWRASRRLLNLANMPTPLFGKSELDMWKMSCGSLCQFCGKKRPAGPSITTDQWRPGPGANGVIPVWSHGIRTCGSCLQEQSIKEIDLLLSSSVPSPLMAALPFIFLTNELHVLSPATLQNGQHPAIIQITKYFSKHQVEDIKQEFNRVKDMGAATAEEWLKGLDGRGKERRNDAARWERWEANGGLSRMRNAESDNDKNPSALPMPKTLASLPSKNGHILPAHPGKLSHPSTQFTSNQAPGIPFSLQNSFVKHPPPRFESPAQNGFAHYPPRPPPQVKHERTKEEVTELKAARRSEIERRCLLLDPPITAGVLAHMASFQAAIQIIQPLVDSSWEVLKPRLLSQRQEAEQRENDCLAQTRVVQERFDERRLQESQPRSDSKDPVEREWDDIQAPLRARISGYADEIIRDGWNGGEKVSFDTAPLFAAEVLVYVRKRFYAEIAKDEAAVRATGREPVMDPPNGPFTRKLILENMKWVFDTKVKPYTELYRKELFLCNACDYANKYYGFEGVIQHYAAKHTSALSVGSVVVHWKSEWPESPPFNPDPSNLGIKPYYPQGPPSTISYPTSGPSLQPNYGYAGFPAPVSTPMQTPITQVFQESPGPYYGHPQFGDQYAMHQNGSFAPPPQPYAEASQGFPPAQYPGPHQSQGSSGYGNVPQAYPRQTYGTTYQAPQQQDSYMAPPPGVMYPAPGPEAPAQQPYYDSSNATYDAPYNQAPHPAANSTKPLPKTEKYASQLQDLARNAREIWNSIGGLKEVPGSLKVYTILHHLLKRYRETYHEEPPLTMLNDGLSSNKDMRPVRNVNGLLCKACSLGMAGSRPGTHKKHFSFPQLVLHFHSIHELGVSQNNLGHVPEWTTDMVELPALAKLTTVVNAPGMDDQKLALFTEALPELISKPRSSVGGSRISYNQQYDAYAAESEYPQLAPSQDNHAKYYTSTDTVLPSNPDKSEFDNGEYDPRHPGDLLLESRPLPVSQRNRYPREAQVMSERQTVHQIKQEEETDGYANHSRQDRVYIERPVTAVPNPALVFEAEGSSHGARRNHYDDSRDVEYQVRRGAPNLSYGDRDLIQSRDFVNRNSMSYQSNGREPMVVYENESRVDRSQPITNAAAQQNRVYEVVAQISQQAQKAREQRHVEPLEAGSEDGEVRAEDGRQAAKGQLSPIDHAGDAAARFLENFNPGETIVDIASTSFHGKSREPRVDREGENRYVSRTYQGAIEPRPQRREYIEDDRVLVGSMPQTENAMHDGYVVQERAPAPTQHQGYAYEERYVSSVPERAIQRDRSPELVDRRYKLNNVIYRDERQGSYGTNRTPSRYARYESVRLENDRTRSRSPVYVKVGTNSGPYRERSPGPHPAHALRQESMHPARSPGVEEVAYERPPPRQEYYRVYADEPRAREPHYAEAFEFVRVSDPQGDYMIRRPVRREQPVYAAYDDDVYARPPTRVPAPRAEPTFYEEEYDPRQPAPPPASASQVRYQ